MGLPQSGPDQTSRAKDLYRLGLHALVLNGFEKFYTNPIPITGWVGSAPWAKPILTALEKMMREEVYTFLLQVLLPCHT